MHTKLKSAVDAGLKLKEWDETARIDFIKSEQGFKRQLLTLQTHLAATKDSFAPRLVTIKNEYELKKNLPLKSKLTCPPARDKSEDLKKIAKIEFRQEYDSDGLEKCTEAQI